MSAEVLDLEGKRLETKAGALFAKIVGAQGFPVFTGFINRLLQDPNQSLAGNAWYGSTLALGAADKLLIEPYCQASMFARRDPILRANWNVTPVSDQPIDQGIAAFARQNLFDRLSWQRILGQFMTADTHGFSLQEPIEAVVDVSPDEFPMHPGAVRTGKGIMYADFIERPQFTVFQTWLKRDNPTQLETIVQNVTGSDVEKAGLIPIPAERLIRFTLNQRGGNVVGRAPFRAAWAPFFRAQVYRILEAIFFERSGAGIPTLTLPRTMEEATAAKAAEMLFNLTSRDNAYMLLEEGMKFVIETARGSVMDLAKAIHANCLEILMAMGCEFLALGSGSGARGGSYALAESQAGQFALSVEALARDLTDCMNFGLDGWSFVARLIKKNFGENVKVPKIECKDLPTRNLFDILFRLPTLVQQRLITPDGVLEDYIRQVGQLPRHDAATARFPAGVLPLSTDAEQVQIDEEQRDIQEDADEEIREENQPEDEEGSPSKNAPAEEEGEGDKA